MLLRIVEAVEDGGKLLDDVVDVQILLVELVVAAVAKPQETIELVIQAFALDDQPDRVLEALR